MGSKSKWFGVQNNNHLDADKTNEKRWEKYYNCIATAVVMEVGDVVN